MTRRSTRFHEGGGQIIEAELMQPFRVVLSGEVIAVM